MARLEFSIQIAAPPERVAAFFVPQRMPYWYGTDLDAEFEVQGGAADFQAGQKVRIRGRAFRRELSLTVVVTQVDPGRCLAWKFRDEYGVRGMQQWQIEPVAGGTRVSLRDEYELPGGKLARLADALFMQRNVARRDRLYLRKLKKLAERAK